MKTQSKFHAPEHDWRYETAANKAEDIEAIKTDAEIDTKYIKQDWIEAQHAQPQHSPLPWHVAEYGIRELKAKYLCIKHGSKTIARIDASGNSLSVTKQDEANAAYIVRACNAYPSLVAVRDHAERLAEVLEGVQWKIQAYGSHWEPSQAEREAIAQALAQWEEGQKLSQ